MSTKFGRSKFGLLPTLADFGPIFAKLGQVCSCIVVFALPLEITEVRLASLRAPPHTGLVKNSPKTAEAVQGPCFVRRNYDDKPPPHRSVGASQIHGARCAEAAAAHSNLGRQRRCDDAVQCTDEAGDEEPWQDVAEECRSVGALGGRSYQSCSARYGGPRRTAHAPHARREPPDIARCREDLSMGALFVDARVS